MFLLAVLPVLSNTSMEWLLQVVTASAFSLYWIWIIVTFLKQKDRHPIDQESTERNSTFSTEIVILCNISISCSYLGFSVYEIWLLKSLPLQSLLPTITWMLCTIFTIYCKDRTIRENESWPLVLKFWWFLFCILDTFILAIFLFTRLKWFSLSVSFPVPKLCNSVSLPFSIFICLDIVNMSRRRNLQELTSPLLQKENADTYNHAFDNAGIWSKLTFQWLNPLFRAGRQEKLELTHVPLVPQPETAENSFSLLQEALLKQKTDGSSLPHALLQSILKPLLMNSIFAGILQLN